MNGNGLQIFSALLSALAAFLSLILLWIFTGFREDVREVRNNLFDLYRHLGIERREKGGRT